MFVWVLEGKADDPEEVGRQLGHWINEFGATPGYLGSTGGVTDDRRFLLFARWESEAAGDALLARPELQAWYDEFQKSFADGVEFTKSADVTTHLAGGSDSAGFVQAMKVSGVDRARIDAADREFERLAADFRPDLIGGARVWTGPDAFIEANYFTSEDAARDGEQKDPPPEVAAEFGDFMEMMKDAEFYDFTEPLLHSRAGG
jgi:quinol monooxygenase YgiN